MPPIWWWRDLDFESWNDTPSIAHNSVVTFSEDTILENQTYSSSWSNEHAILVDGWNVDISNSTITKAWNADWDSADFYWTNAATISTNWQLWLHNVSINTNWKHANAIFAYGSWNVFVADSTITTEGDNSWWLMVTWWWYLGAENLTVTTEWNSSAAIRSDRWGGEMQIERWDYTTNWIWSPVIYSTADITVSHANLTATKSEWAIVEWKNSITISNSTLTDSNTVLNWQSTTYKNIFLYQSMSWDADEWTAKFTAVESKIITNNWDTIYVTNTTAEILLQNNEIINTSWDFLRIEWAAWWKEGSNWWNVTLNLINQNVEWDIIVDDTSSLNMIISEWSNYIWAINSANESENISIYVDNNSTRTLSSDSYISEISSDFESYNNINLNWYTLYLWEKSITNTAELLTNQTSSIPQGWMVKIPEKHSNTALIIWGICLVILIIVIWVLIKKFLNKKK